MITGLIAVVAVLAAASVLGLALRRRQGKFTTPGRDRTTSATSPATADSRDALTAADLGVPLGKRATLVQFSTEFCSNCPQTRRMLGQLAAEHEGIELVEVDAAARLDLTRRLNVMSTPTVLVLGPDGTIASRASGLPRRSDVLAAVGSVLVAGSILDPGSAPGKGQ
ncbi:MAG TPA: thioredoxin family protein [Trebonia sp.]|nr:thioredoxin family protein [Trebonia sp.]